MILLVAILIAAPAKATAELAATRFAYGPHASERETLRNESWADYVKTQLDYERIDDAQSDAAIASIGSPYGTPAELMERYPRQDVYFPGLYRVGALPPEIAEMSEAHDGKLDYAAHKDEIAAWYAAHDLHQPQELVEMVQLRYFTRAVTTKRQLYEEMVDFWLDHFNVFIHKDGLTYAVVAFERDAIRPYALGKFDDLLRAVAESPAMLDYLDNSANVRPGGPGAGQAIPDGLDPATCKAMDPKRVANLVAQRDKPKPKAKIQGTSNGINENYARELLELHTMGVDGGYTQKDVQEVAKAFTGWTVFDVRGDNRCPLSGTAFFAPELHEDGDKVVLGHTIHSSGRNEGLAVLDIVAHHPATAKFIATKLVRRFVSDDPPKALIERAAKAFKDSDGDIREVMRVIASSDEAIAAARKGDKVKRPFDLVVSSLRALDAKTDGVQPVKRWLGAMGQLPFACLTPNGYPEKAGPWVNAGALVERLNFGLALAGNRLKGTTVDLASLFGPDLVFGGSATADALVDAVAEKLVGTKLSDASRKTVIASIANSPQVGDASSAKANVEAAKQDKAAQKKPDPRVARVVGLILGSPEFQHR